MLEITGSRDVNRSRLSLRKLACAGLLMLVSSAYAAIPVSENFNVSFNDPSWQLYGPAALNTGWLRLTNATTNQQGAAILTQAFASSTQIVVTFDYAMYGGTGADGLVFFLQDGAETSIGPGDFGGCLGYCSRSITVQNPRIPGVRSAYFGVGFDLYGNMSDGNHSPTGGPGFSPNNILIKGAGPADGLSGGYQYLTGLNPGFSLATGSRAGAYTIRILLINNVITVQRLVAGSFNTILGPYDLSAGAFPQTLPATLRLGFTAGTGGSTNIHEIDNLKVDFPSDLTIVKSGSAKAAAGGPVSYTLTVTNKGPYTVNNAVITDTVPASIGGVTWACASSGGASCNAPASGSGNALSQSVNISVGGQITISVNGVVNAATTIGTVISNTATVALPNGIADIASADNTSTFNTTVDGAAISIAATTNGSEPGTPGAFTISLAQPVPMPVTVNYTVGGTATAGSDYTTLPGSVVIPANTTSVVVQVPVLDDTILEPTETVIATLSSITSAYTGTLVISAAPNNTATINILDNEKTASMSVPDSTGDVAGDTGVVLVTILNNLGAPAAGVTVTFAVTGSATLSSYTGVTDSNGQISVLVNDTAIEVVNVTASYDSNGDNVADTAIVTGSPGVVTFTVGPGGSGPIHAWHLEDVFWPLPNTVVDYAGTWTGSSIDGAYVQTTSPALPAVGGQGTCGYATFDGVNDNVEIGQPTQNITTSLTLTAWVRTTTTAAGIRYAIARGFRNAGGTANDYEIYLGMNGNVFSAGSRASGGLTSVDAGAATTNTWTHIAATATITSATQATWRLYVNGTLVGTTAGAAWPVNTTLAYWSIGGRSDNNGDNSFQWNGDIDEVEMFNYALSAAQIMAVMGERHGCPGPNLTVVKTVAVVNDTVSVSNPKAIPGATVRYTITLKNTSTTYGSTSVVVTDNFDDSKVSYVPGSVVVSNGSPSTVTDAGGVAGKSDRVTVNSANIPAGGTVTVTFDVKVD